MGLSFEFLLVLLGAFVAVVLLVVLLRREPGRSRRLWRALAGGWADLASPLITLARFRRAVRTVRRGLADPDLDQLFAQAADAADRAGGRAFGLLVAADDVAAGVSARAGTVAPQGWRAGADGWWHTRREQLGGNVTPWPGTPVALGVSGPRPGSEGLLWLDLDRVPGVLAVTGEPRAAHGLVCALAAQLIPAGGVVVTAGVHPRFAGPPLDRALEQLPDGGLLVTANPTPEGSARIAALLRARPDVRVVQVGDHPGTRWLFQVSDGGQVRCDELGLLAESATLERGVAQALARSRSGSVAPRPYQLPAADVLVSGPDLTGRGLTRHDLTEPDLTEPDLTEPDLTEPEPAEPVDFRRPGSDATAARP